MKRRRLCTHFRVETCYKITGAEEFNTGGCWHCVTQAPRRLPANIDWARRTAAEKSTLHWHGIGQWISRIINGCVTPVRQKKRQHGFSRQNEAAQMTWIALLIIVRCQIHTLSVWLLCEIVKSSETRRHPRPLPHSERANILPDPSEFNAIRKLHYRALTGSNKAHCYYMSPLDDHSLIYYRNPMQIDEKNLG